MPRLTPAATEAAPAPVHQIATDSRPNSPLCGEPIEGSTETCGRYSQHRKGPHKPSVRASLRGAAVT